MAKGCGRQLITRDGRTTVTMKSGRVVELHECNRAAEHRGACGWIGRG